MVCVCACVCVCVCVCVRVRACVWCLKAPASIHGSGLSGMAGQHPALTVVPEEKLQLTTKE